MEQTGIPVTAVMQPALEHRARLAAAQLRISRAELVRQAVADFLDRQQPQPQAAGAGQRSEAAR